MSRPVTLQIPADTASKEYQLAKFTEAVKAAPQGHVIDSKQGRGKVASYRIVKTDSTAYGFRIEAVSAAKDSIVYVHDTVTVVHDKTLRTVTHVEKPTFWQGLKIRFIWAFWGVLVVFILFVFRKLTK